MAMRKFVRRFSSASLDMAPAGKKDNRERSVSELVESTESIRISPDSGLEYLGYTYVKDARSLREIQLAIRTVKQTSLNRDHWVGLAVRAGMLVVQDTSGEMLIMSSVACIAQCACELNRVLNDCLAITFGSGHNAKQCHVFQARSPREASELVHHIQKASRGSQKPRARGQTEVMAPLKSPKQLEKSPKLGMHLMEDEEGEVMEHKPISNSLSRNESKRIVVRPPSAECSTSAYLDSLSPYGKYHNHSLGFMTTPPKGKRRGAGGKGGKLRDERAFGRQDKEAQILSAADKITEKNSQLRAVASKRTPSSPFEDALYAMHVSNSDLLSNYIKSGHVPVDACDSSGNSLLHYAVAIGNVDAVKIICQFLPRSLVDARGWNECTATHRAVADGNISILRVLLGYNTNVNLADIMRRTPLHLSSPRKELMECSIALLEAGAQVTATDILGLRPCDLDPELKETQSRLVISACELFSSTAPSGHTSSKNHAPSATPTTASPMSTRPSSFTSDLARSMETAAIRSHYESHDVSHDFVRPHPLTERRSPSPALVAEANARVSQWMKTLGRRSKFREKMSRSVNNLTDLTEEDEEEAGRRSRLEMLKFPSDFNVNSSYYEVVQTAGDVVRNMNDLINITQQSSRETPEECIASGNRVILRRQKSLSEPNLAVDGDIAMDTPPLNHPQSPMLGSKVMEIRPESVTSQSSAGTVVREGEMMRKVSEAFDLLEEDLWRSDQPGGEGGEGRGRRRELVRMSLPVTFSERYKALPSPLPDVRTASETEAIFDEILSTIQSTSRQLDGRVESPDYDRLSPMLPPKSPAFSRGFSTPTGVSLEERLQIGGSLRSKPPRRRDDIVDGPGGVVRRLSRRRNPPFVEELFGDNRPPSIGGADKFTPRAPHRRKISNSDGKSSPVPSIRMSSGSDSIPPSANLGQLNFDLLHQLSIRPNTPQLSVAGSDDVAMDIAVGDLEPATKALKLMVCVSKNKECLETLVSYLCLPKFMDKVVMLAKSPVTPPQALGHIATLITNIFEAGGPDGKKTALGSGFLDLVIKLLHTRDPIPGTCLSLLNSLLISEDDNDHLQKIIRVPSEPLLMYLEPYEMSGSDADSGIGSRHLSRTTPSGSDNQVNLSDSSRPNSGVGVGGNHLDIPLPPGGPPSPSATKPPNLPSFEVPESRSIVSPTLKGPTISVLEARTIVLKMLSVSSAHGKMQRSLAKPHSVTLLCGCLGDGNKDNVTNAVITLANVAQNVDSHDMLKEAGIVARLRDLLSNGARQRYHAGRGLVYLGEMNLGTTNLFSEYDSSQEVDSVLLSTDESDGHSYARGATIEKCVEFLTESVSHLWGGFSLKSGPRSQGNELGHRATKHQITTFFLTCYQTFVHPLILLRLLRHRLATPCSQNPFDWSVATEKHSVPSFAHLDCMPAHQVATLKVVGRWLEDYPDDFLNHTHLLSEVTEIVQRLRLARGPYTTHCHRLRSLLQDVDRPRTGTLRSRRSLERLPAHHNNLYSLLKKVVVTGHLPVALEEAIYLTALQLHIESVTDSVQMGGRHRIRSNTGSLHRMPSKAKKSFTGRIKSSLPVGYSKTKPLMKRVRVLMTEMEGLSERNAKHLFIERCQALPGYECTLYPVKVPQGTRFKKEVKQILGISSKKIVFLDDKTKELVCSYPLEKVMNLSIEDDPCSLVLGLSDGGAVRFHVETPRTALDIRNVWLGGQDGGENQPAEEVVRWSEVPQTGSAPPSLPPPSPSHSSTSSLSSDDSSREATPSPASEKPGNHLPHLTTTAEPHGTTNGPNHTVAPPPSQAVVSVAHSALMNGHMRYDSIDEQGLVEEEGPVPFCDCPPDPEIPRHIVLHQLSVGDVLKCSLECARQMTLIAHEHFCRVTSVELLLKVHLIPKSSSCSSSSSSHMKTKAAVGNKGGQVEIDTRPQTAVERLAYRFNQVGNWVAATILSFEDLDQRVDALQQFILIAKHCLDLRNYSTMMAIVMAGLGSAPIRRLHRTWEGVSKLHMEMFKQMDTILESKSNYKNYRDKLSITPIPAVPYIGVFLKDLTFIADGNPDYIRGGLVNLHKRRQVYQKLEEISHFQQENYNYHVVPELQAYLVGFHPISDEELHSKSHILEPRIRRSHSHSTGRAKTSGGSSSHANFFKVLTRSSSSSSTNLHRTS